MMHLLWRAPSSFGLSSLIHLCAPGKDGMISVVSILLSALRPRSKTLSSTFRTCKWLFCACRRSICLYSIHCLDILRSKRWRCRVDYDTNLMLVSLTPQLWMKTTTYTSLSLPCRWVGLFSGLRLRMNFPSRIGIQRVRLSKLVDSYLTD